MKKSNISVIIPVHELNAETTPMFENAVTSVIEQTVSPDELLIVIPKGSELVSYLEAYDFGSLKGSVRVLQNDGATDFASQINFAVANVTTEWFSILEFDDEFAKIWIKNVVEYQEAHKNVEIFLPIVIDVDAKGEFMSFTNEAVW